MVHTGTIFSSLHGVVYLRTVLVFF